MASEEPDVDVLAKGKEEQLGSEVSRKLEIAEDDNNGCRDLESKLITLISQPQHYNNFQFRRIIPLVIQIISLVVSVDFDSLPKPLSKLISLVTQTVLLFNSIDLDSVLKPLSELISLISQEISLDNSDLEESMWDIDFLVVETWKVKPHPELISLIRQIVYVAISTNSKSKKLISLCPKVRVSSVEGKFHVGKKVLGDSSFDWGCFLGGWEQIRLSGEEDITYFHCKTCNGEYHKEYENAPVEIKHPLHPKHSLHLVWNSERVWNLERKARECYCCDEDLKEIFYYCSACDYAMNIGCVEKTLVLARDHPKWHEHTLALFPSQSSLPCNVCALTHTTCPFYICPPCDFVIHQRCINLPRLIRISRHPHRISFTPYFDQGDWFCGVCRRKINNDCGGYSCIKDNCLYAVHSQCATQTNVWDGIDLEGEPEEIEEEEVEPFVSVGDGIIRHFSHEHHYLRLDENTCRDYDDNKLCQVCITPIYFGKLYYCMQCEYVLHETCANLSRKKYHPIHPHLLTLALVPRSCDNLSMYRSMNSCSACGRSLTAGYFYYCGKEGCDFKVHVQCTTISEPLVHGSHEHPLFLTSKPGERNFCRVCVINHRFTETFNCIECNDFSICFECATLPQKVRYKHDKHILTLSYGEETSTMTYWCEVCEEKIDSKQRFYMCDDYCSITLHIECLFGRDLYMKPGSSFFFRKTKVDVLPNNHHMSRPFCFRCKNRCPQKIVFFYNEFVIYCSLNCFPGND